MATGKTGIVLDPCFMNHKTVLGCPECPDRLKGLFPVIKESPLNKFLTLIPSVPATIFELLQVHSADYLDRLKATEGGRPLMLDEDTCTSGDSYSTAMIAAGGLCKAVDAVCEGIVDNAFALVRPPGHHAERNASMGFCLYNNIAVAARHAQKMRGLERVLIVDWDLHHGNGTQHCFENDPTVLFFSTHLQWIFPGSGGFSEKGAGAGVGYSVNVPLQRGFGDAEYITVYEKLLEPIVTVFKPSIILVSAGFDIHRDDPMGAMNLTEDGFAGLTAILLRIAAQSCGGKLVMVLEGGYNPSALEKSVREVLKELTGLRHTDTQRLSTPVNTEGVHDVLRRVIKVHRGSWPVLLNSLPPPATTGGRIMSALSNCWNFMRG
ncbi:MAG TPA: histone deacetylase [Desulfobacteraceae bacterium]|nr:histone deacetylase [Desulfobacteraceae bacterium]